ncbi:transposase, partial [Paracnuella aquatica]|uniref:transposase n=1 Tax=Paracnuella aquatica TaxID=2268757 RepID=UPI001F4E6FA1
VRQSTVEPVLGTLINFGGMRRVNTRGIAGATKCMLMAAVAYNLKKLLKHTAPKVQAGVVGLKNGPEGVKKAVLRLFAAGIRYRASYSKSLLCG